MDKIVIGDADSLVALAHYEDSNHTRAVKIARGLRDRVYTVLYPNTALLEAMTALKRKHNLGERADLLAQQFLSSAFSLLWVDEMIQREAMTLFLRHAQSKQNTIFDCIVATCATTHRADGIFSFDTWFPKLGISLADDLVS